MQGSKFLKVTGILMIIFSAIGLIFGIIALVGLGALVVLAESMGTDVPMGLLTVSGILAVVGAVVQLIAGIVGVKNWNKPEKAGACILWGIVVIALCVISNVMTLIGYPENFSIISVLSVLVIPVLYLIGGFQNKKLQG